MIGGGGFTSCGSRPSEATCEHDEWMLPGGGRGVTFCHAGCALILDGARGVDITTWRDTSFWEGRAFQMQMVRVGVDVIWVFCVTCLAIWLDFFSLRVCEFFFSFLLRCLCFSSIAMFICFASFWICTPFAHAAGSSRVRLHVFASGSRGNLECFPARLFSCFSVVSQPPAFPAFIRFFRERYPLPKNLFVCVALFFLRSFLEAFFGACTNKRICTGASRNAFFKKKEDWDCEIG